MQSVIETQSLTKIFNQKTIAVNDLYLTVPENSIYGFLGPNGAGKTTTIKLMLGLIRPSAGSVRMFGAPVRMDSSDVRRRIGYLPTQPGFPDAMTPITYLDFIGKVFGIPRQVRIPRITELIRSVDLLPLSSSEIKRFSTGEITRIAMAACLINDPELLILDEPTLGLDPIGRASTVKLITELGNREGKTVFVSSHILADIERFCTHVGIINSGKLIFNGTVTEVKKLIRTNTVELQVEGKTESFLSELEAIPHITNVQSLRHAIRISIDPQYHSETLLDIFKILIERNLELVSLNLGSETLEEAFLDLLEEEKSHGFLRAISRRA
ncbi:MAG: ABC transporter ATP-binding protein [Theionarchaea archaeon]|nr:ABC transporter ATP-binding protein [Theionarchaea archaeon]MBU7036663.1 ABC transporter ATP-binding protein [Theionarchaea archaeon]